MVEDKSGKVKYYSVRQPVVILIRANLNEVCCHSAQIRPEEGGRRQSNGTCNGDRMKIEIRDSALCSHAPVSTESKTASARRPRDSSILKKSQFVSERTSRKKEGRQTPIIKAPRGSRHKLLRQRDMRVSYSLYFAWAAVFLESDNMSTTPQEIRGTNIIGAPHRLAERPPDIWARKGPCLFTRQGG